MSNVHAVTKTSLTHSYKPPISCLVIATINGCTGGIFVTLSFCKIFGSIGSVGFIFSLSGGSAAALGSIALILGALIWIAFLGKKHEVTDSLLRLLSSSPNHAKVNAEAIQILFDNKPIATAKDLKENNLLFLLLKNNDLPNLVMLVKQCVEQGVSVNETNAKQQTPLYIAAQNGQTEIVEYFISQGAVFSSGKSKNKKTLLHYAAMHGMTGVVEHLLQTPTIDIACKDESNVTPLDFAAVNGHLKIVEMLHAKGAPVHNIDANGDSALIFAINEKFIDVALFLIEKGADVNHNSPKHKTPLLMAREKGLLDVVQALNNKGAT